METNYMALQVQPAPSNYYQTHNATLNTNSTIWHSNAIM